MSATFSEITGEIQRTPRTRRRRMIDDPRRPHRLKVGVAYRVIEENGELVVRAADIGQWKSNVKKPHYFSVLDVNPSEGFNQRTS
jgi:hypothetical protein